MQSALAQTNPYVSGGSIVIIHPLGRTWLNETLHDSNPEIVPHPLPDQAQLEALNADLPLRLTSFIDEPELYIATLQVVLPLCDFALFLYLFSMKSRASQS